MTNHYIVKQERIGRILLRSIVITNLAIFSLSLFLSLFNGIFKNLLGIIIMIILSAAIYSGGKTVKWIYIVISSLNIFAVLYTLMFGEVIARIPLIYNITTIVMLVVSAVSCMLLLFSTSVNEFMFKQRSQWL